MHRHVGVCMCVCVNIYMCIYYGNFDFMLFASSTFTLEHHTWMRYDTTAPSAKPGVRWLLHKCLVCVA